MTVLTTAVKNEFKQLYDCLRSQTDFCKKPGLKKRANINWHLLKENKAWAFTHSAERGEGEMRV